MTDTPLSLSAAFAEADEATWRAAVEKALKGKGPDALSSRTDGGIVLKALWREADFASAADAAGYPGAFPFRRGARAVNDPYLPWDIRQIVRWPDAKGANAQILEELEGGASSIELKIDPVGERGLALRTKDDFAAALDGVMLDLAGLGISPAAADAGFGLETAALLVAFADAGGVEAGTAKVAFNVDPLGELTRAGLLATPLDRAMAETAAFARDVIAGWPEATALRVNAASIHEAGGGEAQEIAYAIAAGAEYVQALTAAGVAPGKAARSILFLFAASPDYALTIAKLRAARTLWAHVVAAMGAPKDDAAMRQQAIASGRSMTRKDPYVNMLRGAAACFGAGVGGADVVTVRPFTELLGQPDRLARRIARNTQVIAQEESFLGKVADPAGGAWAVEGTADALIREAYALSKRWLQVGGVGVMLQSGQMALEVGETRKARQKDLARRKIAVTGVSEFADPTEAPAKVETPPVIAEAASTGPAPASRDFADLVAAAKAGASLDRLIPPEEETGATGDPVWPMRDAESFEALRDHADRYARRTGSPPKVFLATLGPEAEHAARKTFAQNFFAGGGLVATTGDGKANASLAHAFETSGARIACLCGSDERYAAEAVEAARLLKALGVYRLYLAGRPGAAEQDLRDAGVDAFIYLGADVIATLETTHAELGLLADDDLR